MSIETKLARAMSELDARGVLVLRDFELGTTRVERIGRGWRISHELGTTRVERIGRGWRISRISRSYHEFDDNAAWVVRHRADVETEIRSWFKRQEQLDYL